MRKTLGILAVGSLLATGAFAVHDQLLSDADSMIKVAKDSLAKITLEQEDGLVQTITTKEIGTQLERFGGLLSKVTLSNQDLRKDNPYLAAQADGIESEAKAEEDKQYKLLQRISGNLDEFQTLQDLRDEKASLVMLRRTIINPILQLHEGLPMQNKKDEMAITRDKDVQGQGLQAELTKKLLEKVQELEIAQFKGLNTILEGGERKIGGPGMDTIFLQTLALLQDTLQEIAEGKATDKNAILSKKIVEDRKELLVNYQLHLEKFIEDIAKEDSCLNVDISRQKIEAAIATIEALKADLADNDEVNRLASAQVQVNKEGLLDEKARLAINESILELADEKSLNWAQLERTRSQIKELTEILERETQCIEAIVTLNEQVADGVVSQSPLKYGVDNSDRKLKKDVDRFKAAEQVIEIIKTNVQ